MDHDQRRGVIESLVALAASDDYLDRADAGRALASFAEMPEARTWLLRLVLDVRDTYVTRVTAEALLRRHDRTGLAIVAAALGSAGDQHGYQIDDAAGVVFMVFASERDQAVEMLDELSGDASAHVRQGAAELREFLAKIKPLLHPQSRT